MQTHQWLLLLACASTELGVGCSNADKTEKAIMAGDLPTSGDAADGQGWESAPFPSADDCAENKDGWLKLEGRGKSEGLVITHELGRVPSLLLAYTSAKASGCGSTLGAGGHTITVIPALDAVVVLRVDTDKPGNAVSGVQNGQLLRRILLAAPR